MNTTLRPAALDATLDLDLGDLACDLLGYPFTATLSVALTSGFDAADETSTALVGTAELETELRERVACAAVWNRCTNEVAGNVAAMLSGW